MRATIKVQGPRQSMPRDLCHEEFKRLMGVDYLAKLEFASPIARRIVQHQCRRVYREGLIDQEMEWLGKLFYHHIQSGFVQDISIRWIDDVLGFGAYAEKDLAAWEYIGEYTGFIKRKHFFFSNINAYCFAYPTAYVHWLKYTIDSQQQGNQTRYINHSDYPNSEATAVYCDDGLFHIIFRAIKDIPRGTQITTDYGFIYWSKRKKSPN
ncbi:MAG: SET domain-containing protein-lysine N-methyltransferase [Chlamydiota bacterium]